MIEVKKESLFLRNPNTGLHESVSMMMGESAYIRDKRRGYVGSEAKWLNDIGCSGGKPELAGEAQYANAIDTEGVGNRLKPVYVDENGELASVRYNLGNSCELEATDNPNDARRMLLTNVALQSVINDIINNEYDPNAKAIIPSPVGTLIYDGTAKSPSWINFDPNVVSIGGVTSAINAGDYTATFTPIEPYTWKDGTRVTKTVIWTIEKAEVTINEVKDQVVINELEPSHNISILRNGNGVIRATSSNPNIVTATVGGNTVTITGNGSNSGNATVSIFVEEDANHRESNTILVDVKVKYVDIVSWTSGSFEKIQEMLDAHYSGIIDVTEYWSIGDKRTITVSEIASGTTDETQPEQDVEFVIVGMKHDTLVNALGTETKAAITVQARNLLSVKGIMNRSHTEVSDALWSTCIRRTWCNNDFFNALPDALQPLLKSVSKITNRCCETEVENYKNYITQQKTNETVFILSDYEVSGENSYFSRIPSTWEGLTQDGEQYEYLKTEANRIKTLDGVASAWTTRSGIYNRYGNVYFGYVSEEAQTMGFVSDADCGIVPAFCL